MHVSANSLSLVYNGITRFTTTSHRLNVSAWPDGAVCAVEVEGVPGRTEFVDLDNMKGCRVDEGWGCVFELVGGVTRPSSAKVHSTLDVQLD